MARRKFTREFKVSAVKLVSEQGYTIPEAAKSQGVDQESIRGWLKKFAPIFLTAAQIHGRGRSYARRTLSTATSHSRQTTL